MTHCYNCGHTGTFVLLVQCALAVPGPDPAVRDRDGPDGTVRNRDRTDRVDSRRREDARYGDDPGHQGDSHHWGDPCRRDDPHRGSRSDRRDWDDRDRGFGGGDLPPRDPPTLGELPGLGDLPTRGDVSLAVQCPACDSTDVGVAATDLLARYGSNTTS